MSGSPDGIDRGYIVLRSLYFELYGMTKAARIRALGGLLAKVNAEIEQADFSKIDPAKLIDLRIKLTHELARYYTPESPPLFVDSAETVKADDVIR